MKIHYYKKTIYGVEHMIIHNQEIKSAFYRITGCKTLTQEQKSGFESLGFEFVETLLTDYFRDGAAAMKKAEEKIVVDKPFTFDELLTLHMTIVSREGEIRVFVKEFKDAGASEMLIDSYLEELQELSLLKAKVEKIFESEV